MHTNRKQNQQNFDWALLGLMLQGFDKVVPPFEALLKFHGGEGFEEVVPLSKTHRNSACLKG